MTAIMLMILAAPVPAALPIGLMLIILGMILNKPKHD